MTDPASPPAEDLPPALQDALRVMSARGEGPVVDLATGDVVARDGRLVDDSQDEHLVACLECARAIALGWFGAITRHPGPAGAPVCVLCEEGRAVLTPQQWFAQVAALAAASAGRLGRRTWREDAVKGLGAVVLGLQPPAAE